MRLSQDETLSIFSPRIAFQKAVSASIVMGLTLGLGTPFAALQAYSQRMTQTQAQQKEAAILNGAVNIAVKATPLEKEVHVKGSDKKITLAFRDVAVGDVLRALGKMGGFNVAIADTVNTNVTVDLNNISIQEALEIIRTKNNLSYALRGADTLMVSLGSSTQGSRLRRSHVEIIPLKYNNASVLANVLNTSVFAPPPQAAQQAAAATQPPGGSTGGSTSGQGGGTNRPFMTITPDFRTNSLIVVGSPSDIQTVYEYVKVLDVARQYKTWRLSHADVSRVTPMLVASLFNEGLPAVVVGGSGGSGGSSGSSGGQQGGQQGGVGHSPTSVPILTETLQEGTGITSFGSAGSSSGGSSTSGPSLSSVQLRNIQKVQSSLSITPNGAILLPDTRLNTLTLFGTVQQIELAEKVIATLDRRAPQVVIEAMLIELSEQASKELTARTAVDYNKTRFSFGNPAGTGSGFQTPFGLNSSTDAPFTNLFRISNNTVVAQNQFFMQLDAYVRNRRAKILSKPSIIAMHDNEAVVSIVDEIVSSVTVTQNTLGNGSSVGSQVNIGQAGVIMDILPKISPNGDISLRVRPSLSTIAAVVEDQQGNTVTLLSKRDALVSNVVLHDGESFVLGGLLQNTDVTTIRKIPGLSDLPIVGALARSSARAKTRTELIIVVTPHIIDDDGLPVAAKALPNTRPDNYLPALKPLHYLENPMGEHDYTHSAAPAVPNPPTGAARNGTSTSPYQAQTQLAPWQTSVDPSLNTTVEPPARTYLFKSAGKSADEQAQELLKQFK